MGVCLSFSRCAGRVRSLTALNIAQIPGFENTGDYVAPQAGTLTVRARFPQPEEPMASELYSNSSGGDLGAWILEIPRLCARARSLVHQSSHQIIDHQGQMGLQDYVVIAFENDLRSGETPRGIKL